MKKNLGSIDRAVRILIAMIIAALIFTQMITGTTAILLGILAVTFTVTSIMGYCPLYQVLGLSTKKTLQQI